MTAGNCLPHHNYAVSSRLNVGTGHKSSITPCCRGPHTVCVKQSCVRRDPTSTESSSTGSTPAPTGELRPKLTQTVTCDLLSDWPRVQNRGLSLLCLAIFGWFVDWFDLLVHFNVWICHISSGYRWWLPSSFVCSFAGWQNISS